MLIVKQTLNSLVLFEPLARPDPDLAAPGVDAEGLEARPRRVPQAVADLRVAACVALLAPLLFVFDFARPFEMVARFFKNLKP